MIKKLSDIKYSLSRVSNKIDALLYRTNLKDNPLTRELLNHSRWLLFPSTYKNPINSSLGKVCVGESVFKLDKEYLWVWGNAKTALIVIDNVVHNCKDSKYIDDIVEAKEELSLIVKDMEDFIRLIISNIDSIEKTEFNVIL